MKQLLLLPFLSMGMLPSNDQAVHVEKNLTASGDLSFLDNSKKGLEIGSQEPGQSKMAAVAFRSQEFCRIELKDFEFDVQFRIVSATVYFSGANFRQVEQGTIISTSLKPVRGLMDRCVPGSIVIFDNVKVMGPDNQLRTIQGLTIMLH